MQFLSFSQIHSIDLQKHTCKITAIQLISDKNKVHEILSDIIKQLSEALHYFVRKQVN